MKRLLAALVLTACGPNVAVDDDDDGGISDGGTTDATTATTATSASTSATTATTMMSTSAPGDASATDDSTTTDTADTGTFLPEPEPDGTGCVAVCPECDLWAQDCPEDEKCMPWANDGGNLWNATKCSPLAAEPAANGEPCVVEGSGVSGIDDCGPRAMCWGVDPLTNEGICAPLCSGFEGSPACPVGLECTIAFDIPLIVCLPPCDPLAPTCAADEVCSALAHTSTSELRFACQPLPPFEPQPYGSVCGGVQICDVGLTCVAAEYVPGCADVDCCTQLGDVETPAPCPDATQSCIPLEEPNADLCYCGVP
jgi:hypothetical protein